MILTKNILLSDKEIKEAQKYFSKKQQKKIKKITKESQYKKISNKKDATLYYTGRILPNQDISTVGKMKNGKML